MDHDARFDRLEAKQDNRLNKHSEAIDTHAVKLAVVSKSSGANEWFVRLLIACLVTGAALMFRDV